MIMIRKNVERDGLRRGHKLFAAAQRYRRTEIL